MYAKKESKKERALKWCKTRWWDKSRIGTRTHIKLFFKTNKKQQKYMGTRIICIILIKKERSLVREIEWDREGETVSLAVTFKK